MTHLIKSARLVRALLATASAVLLMSGCAAAPGETGLRDRATLCLHRGMRYPENPAVRAQAMEAAGEVLGSTAIDLLKEGLRDEHPAVRFAACMSLGQLAVPGSLDAIHPLVNDPDISVRVAAYYAFERMGDFTYRRAWREALDDPSPMVLASSRTMSAEGSSSRSRRAAAAPA